MTDSYVAALGIAAFYLSIETAKFVYSKRSLNGGGNHVSETRAVERKLLEERHNATLRMLGGLEKWLHDVHEDLQTLRDISVDAKLATQQLRTATEEGHKAILQTLKVGFGNLENSIGDLGKRITASGRDADKRNGR